MGHEQLFNRLSQDFPLTNAFLAFKVRSCPDAPLPDYLTFRNDLKCKTWPKRTKVTTFDVNNDDHEGPKLKKRATVSGHDSYTPLAMEICCTPYVGRNPSRLRQPSENSLGELMIETPCQNLAKRVETQMCISEDHTEDLGTWFYCCKTLKGFRDPQVQSNDDI